MDCEDGQVRATYHAQKAKEECLKTWWNKITSQNNLWVVLLEFFKKVSKSLYHFDSEFDTSGEAQ